MRERQALAKQGGARSRGAGEGGVVRGWHTPSSELNFACGEGLVLHDHGAAGGQDHDVQVLLSLVGLLIPVPGHLSVMSRNQSHLESSQLQSQKIFFWLSV